jgi:hypothetical protein
VKYAIALFLLVKKARFYFKNPLKLFFSFMGSVVFLSLRGVTLVPEYTEETDDVTFWKLY